MAAPSLAGTSLACMGRPRARNWFYGVPTAEPLSRDTIARAAKRGYQLLSAIEHPGILTVLDYVQHDLGPALLFEHLPGTLRLDHHLAEREKGLSFYARLKRLRQVDEAH